MKLRLPNKLVAAILAAASPVLFSTLSTATLGAAAVAVVAGGQACASYDETTHTFSGTDNGDFGTKLNNDIPNVIFNMTNSGTTNWANTRNYSGLVQIGADGATETGLCLNNGNMNQTLTLSGTVTGTGLLSKTGRGTGVTLALTGDATGFEGAIALSAEVAYTLRFGSGAAAPQNATAEHGVSGTGDITFTTANNTLDYYYNANSGNPVYITNAIITSGSGVSVVKLRGGASYMMTKGVTLNRVTLENNSSLTLAGSSNTLGNVTGSGTSSVTLASGSALVLNNGAVISGASLINRGTLTADGAVNIQSLMLESGSTTTLNGGGSLGEVIGNGGALMLGSDTEWKLSGTLSLGAGTLTVGNNVTWNMEPAIFATTAIDSWGFSQDDGQGHRDGYVIGNFLLAKAGSINMNGTPSAGTLEVRDLAEGNKGLVLVLDGTEGDRYMVNWAVDYSAEETEKHNAYGAKTIYLTTSLNEETGQHSTLNVKSALQNTVETIISNGGVINLCEGAAMDASSFNKISAVGNTQTQVTGAGVVTVKSTNDLHIVVDKLKDANLSVDATVQISGGFNEQNANYTFDKLTENSQVRLEFAGFDGYDNNWHSANGNFSSDVKLTDVNNTAAWKFTPYGSSGSLTFKATGKWSGEGTFWAYQNRVLGYEFTNDISAWTGTFKFQGNTNYTSGGLRFSGDAHEVNAEIAKVSGTLNIYADTDIVFNNKVAADSLTVSDGKQVSLNDEMNVATVTVNSGATLTLGENFSLKADANSIAVSGDGFVNVHKLDTDSETLSLNDGQDGFLSATYDLSRYKNKLTFGQKGWTVDGKPVGTSEAGASFDSDTYRLTVAGGEYFQVNTTVDKDALLSHMQAQGASSAVLVGAGRFDLGSFSGGNAALPSGVALGNSSQWTGVVAISGYGNTVINETHLNALGNANSYVELSQMKGWLRHGGELTYIPNLILVNGDEGYAINITGTSAGDTQIFNGTVQGSGKWLFSGLGNATTYYFKNDISGWDGELATPTEGTPAQLNIRLGSAANIVNVAISGINNKITADADTQFNNAVELKDLAAADKKIVLGSHTKADGETVTHGNLSVTNSANIGSLVMGGDTAATFATIGMLTGNGIGSVTMAADSTMTVSTGFSGGTQNLTKIHGSGTLVLQESHEIDSNAGSAAVINMNNDFTGALHYQGGIKYMSNLGGASKVVFRGTSNLLFQGSANGETHEFSKNIELSDGTTLGISAWGNADNTAKNILSGAITGAAGTKIQKEDGGGIILQGDLSNFHGEIYMKTGDHGFTFDVAETNSTDATITGGLKLIKTGAGTLTLSGNNTFTGGVRIDNGTIKAGSETALGNVSGGITVNSGGVLDVNGYGRRGSGTGYSVTLNGGKLTNSGADVLVDWRNFVSTLILTAESTVQADASHKFGLVAANWGGTVLTLNADMHKTGDGVFLLNRTNITGEGTLVVEAGELQFCTNGANGSLSSDIELAGGTVSSEGNGVVLGDDVSVTATAVGSSFTAKVATEGHTLTVGGTEDLTMGGVISGTGSLTKTGSNTITLSATNTATGEVTVESGTLDFSNTAHSFSTVTIKDGATVATTKTGAASGFVINGTVNVQAGGTLKLNNHDTLGWGTSSVSSITMEGTAEKHATMGLSGKQTFSTTLNLNGYTDVVNNEDAVANTGLEIFSDGGRLGTINVTGAGNAISTNVYLRNAGTITTAQGAELTISGIVGVHPGNGGAGSFTKAGAGTLILSGNNTYAGGTTVSEGTLKMAHANSLGLGDITVAADGTLDINGFAVTHTLSLSGTVTNTGNAMYGDTNGLADVVLTGNATIAGENSANAYHSVSVKKADGAASIDMAGHTLTVTNEKGIYFGETNISGGGTLAVEHDVVFYNTVNAGGTAESAGTVMQLEEGANLFVNKSSSIGGLEGSGNLYLNSGAAADTTLTVNVASGAEHDSSAKLANNLNIAKTGEGTQTLSGDKSAFNGSLSATAGVLELLNQTSLSVKDLTITGADAAHKATIAAFTNAQKETEANIIVSGKLTANDHATLNADLTMQSGSTTSMANNSSLNMGCALTLNKGMNLADDDATESAMSTLESVQATGYNTRWLYTSVDSLTLVGFNDDGSNFELTDANIGVFNGIDASTYFNNLTSGVYFLTAVENEQQGGWDIGITAPEPTTSALSLLALAGLAARRRRK